MSTLEETKQSGLSESATIAQELDFDNDVSEVPKPPTQNTVQKETSALPKAEVEENAPPKPPRPINPQQQAENTLREAFPSIDAAVVKAVLTASGGNVEPAFNALLGMSDPDSQQEPTPPPKPPRRPQSPSQPQSRSQLEADEMYARQLAEHYNGAAAHNGPPRVSSRGGRGAPNQKPRKEMGQKPTEPYDERERSFLDDDLPVIRDNIKKGFFETQSRVTNWVTSLKKKIDGDEDEDSQDRPPRSATGFSNGAQLRQQSHGSPYGGRRSGEYGRRSADHERYDADPQVLGDDFGGLQLRDDEAPKARPNRPLANPNLFKPTPSLPTSTGRRVSFVSGLPEEITDVHHSSPVPTSRPTSARSSKWQPLSAADPSPVADHDPFSLGDSDDEESRKKDMKIEEGETLRRGSVEAKDEGGKELEPGERVGGTGMKSTESEELLAK